MPSHLAHIWGHINWYEGNSNFRCPENSQQGFLNIRHSLFHRKYIIQDGKGFSSQRDSQKIAWVHSQILVRCNVHYNWAQVNLNLAMHLTVGSNYSLKSCWKSHWIRGFSVLLNSSETRRRHWIHPYDLHLSDWRNSNAVPSSVSGQKVSHKKLWFLFLLAYCQSGVEH